MAVFTPARQLRVFIGADAQDWSACAGRFVPGKASLGEDGLIGITASLEIQTNLLNPESTDPENNPARWRPGQLVRVQVPNAAGTFVDHPQGWLYLLKEPTLDDETGILPLELGCWLTWGDSQEPADDVSAVQVGTETDYSAIAQRYLEAAGPARPSTWADRGAMPPLPRSPSPAVATWRRRASWPMQRAFGCCIRIKRASCGARL